MGLAVEQWLPALPPHPNCLGRPDVSFVRKNRIPTGELPQGFMTIAPVLAVEGVSPRDRALELEQKLVDDGKAGIPLIWVIYPVTHLAVISRSDGSFELVIEDDKPSGKEVISGFRLKIGTILPPLPTREAAGLGTETGMAAAADAGNGKSISDGKPLARKGRPSRRKAS